MMLTGKFQLLFFIKRMYVSFFSLLRKKVYFGRHLSSVPPGSIVLCPCHVRMPCCGLAGIVAVAPREKTATAPDLPALKKSLETIQANDFKGCRREKLPFIENYLGGKKLGETLYEQVQAFKQRGLFDPIFLSRAIQNELVEIAGRLSALLTVEENLLNRNLGLLSPAEAEAISGRIEMVKDIQWCLQFEIIANITKIAELIQPTASPASPEKIILFKEINAVLNSIDRLEVRGRDSAGISLMFIFDPSVFKAFQKSLSELDLQAELLQRSQQDLLLNRGICINHVNSDGEADYYAVTLTYKIAAEIGNLGDNVHFLRQQIKTDRIFQQLTDFPFSYHSVLSHTRWASVGAITEANCHPVDNCNPGNGEAHAGRIYVCLNGDIDNYLELKASFEADGELIHKDITTDTKIIPLQIAKYYKKGNRIEEAFRLAVNDFKGSHAISMHTDLAPGKLFLAQKGSGQAVFIGLARDHFMPTSEVYGFVEETPFYVKINSENAEAGRDGIAQGQIFILDQQSTGGLEGLRALCYDGTPVALSQQDIKRTEITTRDIDRQEFPHYFLKEITESSISVAKTLQNRWKRKAGSTDLYELVLDEKVLPTAIQEALVNDDIRRVYFVGQGTAGVAALACADILENYLAEPHFHIRSLKASELSGFILHENDHRSSMADALVVAITQSGTTTDTNRTIDMVRERGAHTIAIVNRRDSDITFKVDGVMYTSTGRDIEMSVASTKAFYSQIIAGALLGLQIARLKGRRNDRFVSDEIRQMLELPGHMKRVLALKADIEKSARKHAVVKTYWAAVGSGPNKAAADEIRIKLSELCYKTISSDYIEDKKHIDLSSEPLIIICAAGVKGNVIGDIVKDTAIFQAHKATPIVIADEGEERFLPYAADVFHVPMVQSHFAPILNTLVGHLWGYYAALAINAGSKFLYDFRESIQQNITAYSEKGLDIYEVVLEKRFRENIAQFYNRFKQQRDQQQFPTTLAADTAANLVLLLKYLSGRLPVADFELDFRQKGTALNMLNTLFACIGEAINCMARPIDAIKHQAKTVTVGTSRIREEIEGLLFEALTANNFSAAHLTPSNIIVLRNLQGIVSAIQGAILYRIGGLNLLGELTEQTTINLIKKSGSLAPLPSRVETDSSLKGTKQIIVRQGNVYIGKGRKDDRNIIIIPIISDSPATPNIIAYLLLLHVSFKKDVPLAVKIRALGGKFEHIKNIVQENSIPWEDHYLERVEMERLFGVSAEKVGEFIVASLDSSAVDPNFL